MQGTRITDADDLVRITRGRLAASTGLGRSLRLAAGLSLRELAEAIGVSQSALFAWERGTSLPTREHAGAYLDALERVAGREVKP